MGRRWLSWELDEALAWADATFPQATRRSILAHLRREVDELARAHASDDADALRLEVADVLLLLAHYARHAGIDLADAVADKLEINRARAWGTPDAEGVVEHVP